MVFHSRELETSLHYENIDIALITETHFTNKKHLKILGFTIYRSIHPSGRAHGGSIVIVKNNIRHFQREEVREYFLQGTMITVVQNNRDIVIASVYCPPRRTIKSKQLSGGLTNLGPRFI